MARSTPPLRLYEAQSAPPARAAPMRPNLDLGPGIGASLSRAGDALQNVAQAVVQHDETQLHIAQIQQQQREDEGRVQAAQALAQFRSQVSDMRREVFDNAPNGYENATQSTAANFEHLRQQVLENGRLSPEAARFFNDSTALYQPEFLDQTAEMEAHGRDQYQADSIGQAIETNANILIGDPSQYDHISAETDALIAGIHSPHLRRDAEQRAGRGLAAAAVSGLINRDPSATLRRLQASEPDALVSRLSAAERDSAIRSAHAEAQRRQAQAQVAVAQAASTAQARWAVGLEAPNAPSFESVYQTLGPQAALNFETMRLQGQHTSDLVGMTNAQLAPIAAAANDPSALARGHEAQVGGNRHTGAGDADLRDAISRQARAQAAAAILNERATDPMQQQVRQGLVPQSDIVGAVRSGDWGMVNGILANRAAAAEQHSARLGQGTPALPLTAFEARNVGQVLSQMPAQDRAAVLRNFAAWTGGGVAYQNLMGQLFPSSPASAYAGYISGFRTANNTAGGYGSRTNEHNADIILRGEDLLGGRDPNATGDAAGRRSNTPLVSLPSENHLRQAWQRAVGDAYSGWGTANHPDNQAEEQSYQVFRSAYAALSYDAHADPTSVTVPDPARVGRAVAIATGGIMNWGGHRVVIPPGMNPDQFDIGVRTGFLDAGLTTQDPTHYALRAIGPAANGGGLYVVYNGDNPLIINGRVQTIEVRR